MINVFGLVLSKEQITIIAIIATAILYALLWYNVWADSISKYTIFEKAKINKSLTRMTKDRKLSQTAVKRRRNAEKYANWFRKMKVFPFTKAREEEINELIFNMEITSEDGVPKTANEYYVQSCIFAISALLTSLFLALLWSPCIMGLVAVPFVYGIPYSMLRKQHMENIRQIEVQMPKFISMFYYRFRDETQLLRLDALIADFLPLANVPMRRLLMQLNTDLSAMSDIEALEKLIERYPESRYVHSFCTVAIGVWKKQQNAYLQLYNLYSELKLIRRVSFHNQMEEQTRKISRTLGAIWLLFGMEMTIFIIFQIAQI